MRKNSKRNTALREALSGMPALDHWPDRSVPFQIENSEVVAWLVKQPVVMERIFQLCREVGGIRFNDQTKLWYGVS